MWQGEKQVVIYPGSGASITLELPVKATDEATDEERVEVYQALAERLWKMLVNDFEDWARESYGYVPQAGTPEYFDLTVDLTQKWRTFTEPDTARQRDAAYRLRSQLLEQAHGIHAGIRFFHAAQTVNHFLSLNEYFGNVVVSNISAGQSPFNLKETDAITAGLNTIGKQLMEHNDPILAAMLETSDTLPSPYHNSLENMSEPTADSVDAAIDWDIHMVWREQEEVERIINDLKGKEELKDEDLQLISGQFAQEETARNIALGESAAALDWAARAVGVSLDFDEEIHRRAIGIAMMFHAHGRNHEDFAAYYKAMMQSVNAQAGQDVYTLPSVDEVLGHDK